MIRLDPERHRIALSRKRTLPNPWDTIESNYSQGDIVPVHITRVVDFGAFAQIEPGVEGLIHISELADITVAEPLKTVRPGDDVMAKILRIRSAPPTRWSQRASGNRERRHQRARSRRR